MNMNTIHKIHHVLIILLLHLFREFLVSQLARNSRSILRLGFPDLCYLCDPARVWVECS